MAAGRKEKLNEKYAWAILFVMGLFFFLSMIVVLLSPGIFTNAEDMVETLTGAPFSQISASSPGVVNYIYYLIRLFAFFGAGIGAFIMAVSATVYRRGEAWAWSIMWLVPVLFLFDFLNDYLTSGYVDVSAIIIVTILVVGLLLPYRKFFPKKQLT